MKYDLERHTPSHRISPTTIIICICVLLTVVDHAYADVFNGYQAGNWPEPTLSASTACHEGPDYTVTISNTGSPITVLSIHGNGIEKKTSDISAALANLYGWNRYDFQPHGTTTCLGQRTDLELFHITATHFDDPRAVSLVNVPKAVAIHGYADSRGWLPGDICVGGLDSSARSLFITYVNSNASSWAGAYALTPRDATTATSGPCFDSSIAGKSTANIVNRTSSGGGLQLELNSRLRVDLANTTDHSYDQLRNIIYGGINAAMQTSPTTGCSDGWYITGYYVPREDEMPGTAQQIFVEGVGNLSFSQNFLSETQTEGWGITRFGWALGYYSSTWHRSDAGPLDASGNVLTVGTIAVDRSIIPAGAQVQIPTLPSPWGSMTFQATDTGGGIVGQHIDVFTGTGTAARDETFRITSTNNRVCFAGTSTGDLARYNFESGTQGWQAPGGVASSDLHSFNGDRSLAVFILNQVGKQQASVLSPGVPAGRTITFRVWVSANSGVTAIQPYVLEGSAGGWRWTGTYKSVSQLQVNGWNAIQVTVPANATALYSLGVEFTTDGSNSGTEYVDSIDW
jgi:phage replication-related protein YjqB (UPF0714/DUF867 family)/3D (Asp-Asp-Asp) domain-containing protein